MLSLDGICFAHHGRGPLTDGLELEVAPGEVHLLEGPSGSGKSTILRIAAGLIPRVQGGCIDGQVRLDGDPVHRIPPAQLPHRIGWVPQDPEESFTARTVESELTRLAWKVETSDAEQAATRALAELGAQGLLQRETDTLSGGEAALVSLAAAGLTQPDVLVLDEPTATLDASKTKRVAAWLEEHRRRGACILAAAHPPHPLASMAKKVHAVEPIAAQTRASPSTPNAPMAPIATMSDQAEARMAADSEGQRAAPIGEDAPAAAPTIPEAEGGGPLARLTSATRDYEGGPTLGGFDLELAAGEVVCLSGPNGSGKTTALHMLCGLIEPDEGQAHLMSEAPSQLSPRELASRVAIAFQHPAWHITQDTLAQEVAFTCEQLDRSVEVIPLLERLGLASYAGEHPWDLSGGERQRMALATARAHEPPVLLLDEPTRGLDPASLHRIAGLLTERVRSGKATLVASHHPWMHELAHRTVRLEAPT